MTWYYDSFGNRHPSQENIFNFSFNPPPSAPREIKITMVDPLGKRYTVMMPMATWQQIKITTPEYGAEELKEQQRRMEEQVRREQERQAEEARLRREEAAWRKANERAYSFRFQMGNEDFIFFGADDGQRSQPRTEHKTQYGPGSSRATTNGQAKPNWSPTSVIELIKLAGVETEEAAKLTVKQLYRKAQRRCHPDTGGSHDLWLKLEKLVPYLDI